MNKKVFWIGVVVLVVGIVLFYYCYSTIQDIKYRVDSTPYSLDLYFLVYPAAKQQWDLANLLQPIGLGVLVFGVIILAYGLLVRTESK